MRQGKHIYHVYIMTNRTHSTLYVGMTGIGYKRTEQHINKVFNGFTKKYNVTKLVYFEEYSFVWDAIAREKQIKRWSRKKKEWLIETRNPNWDDLYRKYIDRW
ncbi:GIY-YIG nuclease family protein [Rhodohalobacter sulfatireducens]|nr:GIY-YIG nuclease family protein [Rhodohalobacter sulfatireducens]